MNDFPDDVMDALDKGLAPLLAWRMAAAIGLRQLATTTGIDFGRLSDCEAGKLTLTPTEGASVADALGAPLDWQSC